MRDLNPAIYAENIIVLQWYDWIAFVALGVALLGAFWIFYDSQRKGTDPLVWKVLIVVAIVFLVPSVAIGVDERIAQRVIQAVPLLAYLGIGAAVVSLVSILAYLTKLGYEAESYYADGSWGGAPVPPVFPDERPTAESPAAPMPQRFPPAESTYSMPSGNVAQPLTENLAGGVTGMSVPGAAGVGVGPAKTELLNKLPEEIAYLIVRSGVRAGKEYRLADVTTIGRDGQHCDIVLDDGAVSRQHAKVKLEKGSFVLYDLASTSGTKVNNQEINKHVLEDGDQVNIGRITLAFLQVNTTGNKT